MIGDKKFDCVEMKRQGQRRLHEILKDMTPQQQMEWWQQRNDEFMRKQGQLRAEPQPTRGFLPSS